MWTAQSFSCPAGQYLEADNVTCTTCPVGSYCSGFTNTTFADADIGATLCSTVGDGLYTLSPSGAIAEAYCYKTATATCAAKNPYLMGHGTATYTNNTAACKEYYGVYNADADIPNVCTLDSASACSYTLTCDTGYRSTGTNGALSNYTFENGMVGYSKNYDTSASKDYCHRDYYSGSGGYGNYCDSTDLPNGFSNLNRYEWRTEWMDGTTVHGIASCQASGGIGAYYGENINALLGGQMTPEAFLTGMAGAGATADQISFVQKILTQYAAIMADPIATSSQQQAFMAGAMMRQYRDMFLDTTANYTAGGNGQYCWCKMDGYALAGGANVASAGAWVFRDDYGNASDCANECAFNCAAGVRDDAAFRSAVFGSLGTNMECTANTINLNWYADATSQTPLTVDSAAQQCTYDQPITVPSTNPTKPGYTFAGWTLRQTQNNNNN